MRRESPRRVSSRDGRKDFQGKWFYNFSLEERVPQDHLLRVVAKTIDFSFVRDLVRHTYSHTRAQSVDPVVGVAPL